MTYKGRCFMEKHPFLSLTQSDFELNSLLLSLDGLAQESACWDLMLLPPLFVLVNFVFLKNDDYFLILTN